MRPLVSIIIPVYNAERWIAQTVESALAQTWDNKEVIVVNDGSTDQSLAIAKRYESSILKIISQQNRGCSAAKQTALEHCNGAFIQYLDADDLLSPNKIEAQMKVLLVEPETVAVCRTVYFQDGDNHLDNEPPEEWHLYNTDNPVEFLINLYGGNGRAGMISANAYLIPRSVAEKAGGWDLMISPSPDEDGEYFCRVILASAGIRFVPTALNYYRKHRGGRNLSSLRSLVLMQGAFKSLELIAEHLLALTDDPRAKRALARQYMERAFQSYPDFPEVSELALHRVDELGGTNCVPKFGTWRGQWLSKVIGWKLTKRIQMNVYGVRVFS